MKNLLRLAQAHNHKVGIVYSILGVEILRIRPKSGSELSFSFLQVFL